MIPCLLFFALALGGRAQGSALNGQQGTEAWDIDFRNFTFPFPQNVAAWPVPADHVIWRPNETKTLNHPGKRAL